MVATLIVRTERAQFGLVLEQASHHGQLPRRRGPRCTTLLMGAICWWCSVCWSISDATPLNLCARYHSKADVIKLILQRGAVVQPLLQWEMKMSPAQVLPGGFPHRWA